MWEDGVVVESSIEGAAWRGAARPEIRPPRSTHTRRKTPPPTTTKKTTTTTPRRRSHRRGRQTTDVCQRSRRSVDCSWMDDEASIVWKSRRHGLEVDSLGWMSAPMFGSRRRCLDADASVWKSTPLVLEVDATVRKSTPRFGSRRYGSNTESHLDVTSTRFKPTDCYHSWRRE